MTQTFKRVAGATALALAVATSLIASTSAQAVVPQQKQQVPGYYRLKLGDLELTALYDIADLFLCASEHEGFCVPLIEAFYKRVPVVAYASTAVPATMDGGGVLYETKDPRHVARILEAEQEMVEGVFKLADRRVGALMTPRRDIVFLATPDPAGQANPPRRRDDAVELLNQPVRHLIVGRSPDAVNEQITQPDPAEERGCQCPRRDAQRRHAPDRDRQCDAQRG